MNRKSVIFGLIIIIIVIIITTGCTNNKALTPDNFKKQMGAIGYKVVDTDKSKYESKTYMEATKSDVPYTISYYEFESEIEAEETYQKYKSSIGDYITTDSENIETKGSDFTKTVATSEEEYIVISKVKNTLIFVNTTKDYTNTINEVLNNINY